MKDPAEVLRELAHLYELNRVIRSFRLKPEPSQTDTDEAVRHAAAPGQTAAVVESDPAD